jgi:hypothetical protein
MCGHDPIKPNKAAHIAMTFGHLGNLACIQKVSRLQLNHDAPLLQAQLLWRMLLRAAKRCNGGFQLVD